MFKRAFITSGALYLQRIDSVITWTDLEENAARFPLNSDENRPDFVDHIAAALGADVTPCESTT